MRLSVAILCSALLTGAPFLEKMHAQSGQLSISRIDKMPNAPAPYNLRDWKQVARQYDSFVYDVNKTGQYLPLSSIGGAGINYPQNKTIKLASYVGSTSGSEAINILPSLVSATLVGNDKSNQFGENWLQLAQDFFNKANGENIYLNSAGANSGNDGWYDVMPNVFFYQLLDLKPNLGTEANNQFLTIADRFLEAVKAMGGSDTPWSVPNMNYRAWKFKTMQGNASGVKEPEMAGAYAWVLYNAYKKTGNKVYLEGAEWAMEFLDNWQTNPSYELQLPYGTYTAAKMNAELGTNYDIAKKVNWSFDRGEIRGWGTIVGKWGGFDVSGVVGEANDAGNDYAFQLNGVQQAAALVPMVRYDKRFARAIGKWILNLANTTRLFYPGFLPDNLQDASAWSNANDPNRVIGYEALRQVYSGQSPFSTGDALKGGWAATNLSIYSSSSIGYLGALMAPTNVEKILQLDLLKTDFYKDKSYPTYLYDNPNNSAQTVTFDAGSGSSDIYEALSETFLSKNVSGTITIAIQPDQAVVITVVPTGGKISYKRNQMLVNGVVVDYRQSKNLYTNPVRIKALAASKKIIQLADSTTVFGTAFDPDGGAINYKWSTTTGTISGSGKTVTFKSPISVGISTLQLIVTDTKGNSDTATMTISVVTKINQAPVITSILKSTPYINTVGNVQFVCNATDPNGDSLTYKWSVSGGNCRDIACNISNTRTINWIAPPTEGIYTINVTTSDGFLEATASTTILVKNYDETLHAISETIAFYPFSNNTNDISGNQLHGQGSGIVFVPDRNGAPLKACYFNGGAQNVKVPNAPILNFQDAITVSAWFNANQLPDKETFLLSHGSWQNRWKISFTPDKTLRWTVNTLNTIADLDAPTPFVTDSFYNVTATYDGSIMALFVNSQLVAYKSVSGKIRTTAIAFMMGQILPDDATYNFKGVLDEVKIFDYAVTPNAVKLIYQQTLLATHDVKESDIENLSNLQISPNPATNFVKIKLPFSENSKVDLIISDILGKVLFQKTLLNNAPEINLELGEILNGFYIVTAQSEGRIVSGKLKVIR